MSPSPFAFFKNRNNRGEKTAPGPSSLAQTEHSTKGQRKLGKSSIRGHDTTLPVPGGASHPMGGFSGAPPSSLKGDASVRMQGAAPQHVPGVPTSASNHYIGDNGQPFPPPYRMNSFRLMQDKNGQTHGFTLEDTGPVVSGYFSHGRYPQVQHAASSAAPSRAWSPIPSVHRESKNSTKRTGEVSDGGTWKEESSRSLPKQAVIVQPQPMRASGMSMAASLGDKSSVSEQELRYLEYPSRPPTPGRSPEVQHLAVIRSDRQEDENVARRKPPRKRTTAPAIGLHHHDADGDPEPDIYNYIIPSGRNIIFQDEDGIEITRVSKTGIVQHMNQRTKNTPIIVYDQFGKVLYRDPLPPPRHRDGGKKDKKGGVHRTNSQLSRMDNMSAHNAPLGKGKDRSPWGSQRSSRSTRTILIDDKGNQIPM